MSVNSCVISGNLGREPELRTTKGGMSVLSFSVAVNERRKNSQTGEWEDYTNWVGVTMFGKRAEAVKQYLSKGAKVAVEGKLRYSEWEKDGGKRSKLEVIADEIELMSARQSGQSGGTSSQGVVEPPDDIYEDDCPF